MPKKVRPGSKRLPPWQTPQTQCRGSYSRKMSKKGVFEQAKDTFSLPIADGRVAQGGHAGRLSVRLGLESILALLSAESLPAPPPLAGPGPMWSRAPRAPPFQKTISSRWELLGSLQAT